MNYKNLNEYVKSRPWYASWLTNTITHGLSPEKVLKHSIEYDLLRCLISSAFVWSRTPEGRDYWGEIACNIDNDYANYMQTISADKPKKFEYFEESKLVAIIDVKECDTDKPVSKDVINFLKSNGIEYTKLEFDYKDECFKAYVESSGFRECGK